MAKTTSTSTSSQIDKFKEIAKQVETDDSEKAFDRTLKKVAKSSASKDKSVDSKQGGRS